MMTARILIPSAPRQSRLRAAPFTARMPPDDSRSTPHSAVEVRTPARAHLGMLSFGHADRRSYGGVGIMLDQPGVHLRVRRAARYEARGCLADRAVEFARACAERMRLGAQPCAIDVLAAPRPHVGLGSGTQLGLAVAAAVRFLAGGAVDDAEHELAAAPTGGPVGGRGAWRHSFDIPDAIALARWAGRGGRSSVGVYGFSRGGLIVEAGRRVGATPADEDAATRSFSPLVAHVGLPAAWRCVVIVRRDAVGLHGEAEKAAFRALPPVPREVSAELARIALLEMLPAAIEGRFAEFSAAVRRYGRLAGEPFAPASRTLPQAAATDALLDLLERLDAPGCAQSSWGPAVVACCESADTAAALVEALRRLGEAAHHDILIARFDVDGASLRAIE